MEEKFESGMYWLSGLEMPWLLVIDNADDLEFDYSRYFPSGERGHILVTSRNPECRIHATIGSHEFKDMEEEDSITLVGYSGVDSRKLGATSCYMSSVVGHVTSHVMANANTPPRAANSRSS